MALQITSHSNFPDRDSQHGYGPSGTVVVVEGKSFRDMYFDSTTNYLAAIDFHCRFYFSEIGLAYK